MMDDIPDLLAGLRRTPKIVQELVKTIPESKRILRRGDGFWTIDEHVGHLAEVQPMLLERFQRFMHEDRPEFVPFIPSKHGDEPATPPCKNMAAALLQFAEYRKEQLALLESAGHDIWQRTAIHPEYEQYSLYILTRHVLMHDFWHMYRMEELWLTKDAYLTKLE
ncbi:MAG: DinB family protein [Pseudomonadota bacterium]